MGLLHTINIELREFHDKNVPPYATLSHRWGDNEISFQDIAAARGKLSPYSKLVRCCLQAAFDGWEYVWIDTCGIDKTSSAELSEAVNSMCQWYRHAGVCYAYLDDVNLTPDHWRM